MKHFGIKSLLLTTGLLLVNQQAKSWSVPGGSDNAKSIILEFLREVYETQDDALVIAHKRIGLEESPNELSTDKRYEIAAANITLMRKGEGVSSFSPPLSKREIAALRIAPYASLVSTGDNKLLHFELNDSQNSYLYVALKNNVVWKYFFVKEGKIYSFDYLLKGKGGPVYLFSY